MASPQVASTPQQSGTINGKHRHTMSSGGTPKLKSASKLGMPSSPPSLAARVVDRRRSSLRDDTADNEEEETAAPRTPLVRTTLSILEKYKDSPPSLTLHLHPTHFRFEQQEGVFLYNSPMKSILEFIRHETIPPDVVEVFSHARVKYYNGCLTVEVRDHRRQTRSLSTMHSNNEHITRAPTSLLYDKAPEMVRSASTNETGQEKTYRTVLHPSPESFWAEMCLYTEISKGRFDDEAAVIFESEILATTTPPLILDAPATPAEAQRIIAALADPKPAPQRLQKRKASEAEQDAVQRANEEKWMLIMDEKQGRDFQPKFQRLAYIEVWKRRKEKLAQQAQLAKATNHNSSGTPQPSSASTGNRSTPAAGRNQGSNIQADQVARAVAAQVAQSQQRRQQQQQQQQQQMALMQRQAQAEVQVQTGTQGHG